MLVRKLKDVGTSMENGTYIVLGQMIAWKFMAFICRKKSPMQIRIKLTMCIFQFRMFWTT